MWLAMIVNADLWRVDNGISSLADFMGQYQWLSTIDMLAMLRNHSHRNCSIGIKRR